MHHKPLYALQSRLTIPGQSPSPAADPEALALAALGWVLADQPRADRLLALTGLTPDHLRTGLTDSAVLSSILDFLCAHEPDLIAAADALGVNPDQIVAAQQELGT